MDHTTATTSRRPRAVLTAATDDLALLPISALVDASSRCRSQLYADIRVGKAPEPDVRLGPRCVRWRAGTVRAWLKGLVEDRQAA